MECIILNSINGLELELAIKHIVWMVNQTAEYGGSIIGISGNTIQVQETLYEVRELIESARTACSFAFPFHR